MKQGEQWVAMDARFFHKPFPIALKQRFGACGLVLFHALIYACKLSRPAGRFTYSSDFEALSQLGLDDVNLVDSEGKAWTLDDFWEFTGRHKQTRRTRRGHVIYVKLTHWERWQNDKKTFLERERKRRSRAKKGHTDVTPDSYNDSDNYMMRLSDARDTTQQTPQDALADRLASVTGKTLAAAQDVAGRLRSDGLGDLCTDEAAGMGQERGDVGLAWIEKRARQLHDDRNPSGAPGQVPDWTGNDLSDERVDLDVVRALAEKLRHRE